jgi:Bacterial surface proteins containing Ig-like domains
MQLRRRTKWLSLLLMVTLLVTILPSSCIKAGAAELEDRYDTTWYTGNQSTYYISTAEQLAGLAYLVNNGLSFSYKTISLTNDIDLTGKSWAPIGKYTNNDSDCIFRGTFDGTGHVITGLTIGSAQFPEYSYQYAGLFGNISSNAIIKNTGLKNISLFISNGNGYMGGLVGLNQGLISNCYVSGSINITQSIFCGGLAGVNMNSIKNSYASVNITGKSYNGGGLVGSNNYATIENSYATGNISSQTNGGGLVGNNSYSKIINCYATGQISDSKYMGGLVGTNNTGTIINAYYNNVNKSGYGVNDSSPMKNLTGLSLSVMKGAAPTTGITYFLNNNGSTAITNKKAGAFLTALNGGRLACSSNSVPLWLADTNSSQNGYPKIQVIVENLAFENRTMTIAINSPAITLKPVISPANADNQKLIWSSSNEKVATVSSDGRLTLVTTGTATITVKTQDGLFKDTCDLVVLEK